MPPARLGYLDGLRAVAVLLVIAFHARVHLPGVHLEEAFKEGSHGVDLFFVLSGFCLARPTLEKLARGTPADFDLAAYAGKRMLRILPPYAAAVAIFTAVGAYLMRHGIALPPGMFPFGTSEVMSELLFLDRGLHHINASFWSLAVEFRWYFIFPVALAVWAHSRRSFVALLALVVVASELTRASSTDVGVLPAFLLGIAAAGLSLRGDHPIHRHAAFLCVLSIVFGLLNERRDHFPIQTNVGWHFAAFFFVLYAGRQAWLRAVLASRPLRAIGTASYSIYLVHEPIVGAIVTTFGPRIGGYQAMALAGSAGIAAGFAFWAIVERPITRPALVAAFVRRTRAAYGALLNVAAVPQTLRLQPLEAELSLHQESPAAVLELRSARERVATR